MCREKHSYNNVEYFTKLPQQKNAEDESDIIVSAWTGYTNKHPCLTIEAYTC